MLPILKELADGTLWLRLGLQKVDLDTQSLSAADVWRAAAKAGAENVLSVTTLPRPMRLRLLTLWCQMLSEPDLHRAATHDFDRDLVAVDPATVTRAVCTASTVKSVWRDA